MTKIYDNLPSGMWQRLLRAMIADHVSEHSASFYKHPTPAAEGYGEKAERALFTAFTGAYPYWTCSFEEYREVLHDIHPVNVAANPLQR